MKVWITKYALSTGIQKMARHPDDKGEKRMVQVVFPSGPNGWALFFGNDWHTTHEAAIKRAREMRLTRIASLQKQITKLEKLKF